MCITRCNLSVFWWYYTVYYDVVYTLYYCVYFCVFTPYNLSVYTHHIMVYVYKIYMHRVIRMRLQRVYLLYYEHYHKWTKKSEDFVDIPWNVYLITTLNIGRFRRKLDHPASRSVQDCTGIVKNTSKNRNLTKSLFLRF